MSETLLNAAIRKYFLARMGYSLMATVDEGFLKDISFNLQQAVELAMKFTLEENGVQYEKTHDIAQLIRTAKENGVDLYINDFIENEADMISMWEVRSRYITGFLPELKQIKSGMYGVEEYIRRLETVFGIEGTLDTLINAVHLPELPPEDLSDPEL